MPIAHIYLKQGRTKEQKSLLMKSITKAICEALDSNPQQVRIILSEVDAECWGVGDMLLTDGHES